MHHVAANGIENSRQKSPPNAVAIADLLLSAGADPDAVCTCYGDSDTALGLLVSSCHPAEASVHADLVESLCRGGAAVNGRDDDDSPLWTAIVWGYGDAAARLAACGARVDNLVFAATLGDLDLIRTLSSSDAPLARSAARIGWWGPPLDPARILEYATIYASGLGQLAAVELLLTRNPDLSFTEPIYNVTALGAASYHHPAASRPLGNPAVVALLKRHLG